jgi:tetratricopeptide (TPR) repeat protein
MDGPNGLVSTKATRFLKSHLPRYPVSREVEAVCAEVVSKSSTDVEATKALLKKLMEEHPSFEWPYMMMASVHLMDRSISEAEKLLLHLLSINPEYAGARRLLINLNLAEQKIPQALELINQSLSDSLSDDESLHLDLLKAQCARLSG